MSESGANKPVTRGPRPSQQQRALRSLRALIIGGDLTAGERLSEAALADQLGVSRTPLRQALARLVDEGLLERTDTGRCSVARFSPADIADAIELRGTLEGTAARFAAERGIDAEAERRGWELLARIDELADGGAITDVDAYAHLNQQFHDLLGELAQSRIVERELDRVKRLPVASPNAFVVASTAAPEFLTSLAVAQAQHRAVFEAIVRREGTRAEAVAREHARLALNNLELATDPNASRRIDVPGLALVSDDIPGSSSGA